MPHEWLIMHPGYAVHVRMSSYTHVWNHSCQQIGSWVEHGGKVDEGRGSSWRMEIGRGFKVSKVKIGWPRPASVPWLSAVRSLDLSALSSQESTANRSIFDRGRFSASAPLMTSVWKIVLISWAALVTTYFFKNLFFSDRALMMNGVLRSVGCSCHILRLSATLTRDITLVA